MVGNGWAKPFARSPDEAPGRSFDECAPYEECVGGAAAFATDEARRRRCDPVETWVAEGEARLWML